MTTSEPSVSGIVEGQIWTPEVQKYLRYLSQVAEPNLSRVREIKEEIKKEAYPTREMVEETADRLALRFLRRE